MKPTKEEIEKYGMKAITLAEKILRASGSSLENYTLRTSRDAILTAASGEEV